MGNDVEKLDWYNNISKTVKTTPDNRLVNTRYPTTESFSNYDELAQQMNQNSHNIYNPLNTQNSQKNCTKNVRNSNFNLKNYDRDILILKNKLSELDSNKNELANLYHKAQDIIYRG